MRRLPSKAVSSDGRRSLREHEYRSCSHKSCRRTPTFVYVPQPFLSFTRIAMTQTLEGELPTTLDTPQTHGDLAEPLTRIINGQFARRRAEFAMTDPHGYEVFLQRVSRLNQSQWGQNHPTAPLSDAQLEDFEEVVRLLGGRVNGAGVGHTLGRMVASGWRKACSLFGSRT